MRGIRALIWLAVLTVVTPVSTAWSQSRFSSEIYRAWGEAADGRPCETRLFGLYRSSNSTVGYPATALEGRISGDVLLIFDTSFANGALSMTNARVFASQPEGLFDEAALAIATEFEFPSSMRNCEGLRAMLRFRVNNANADGVMRGFVPFAEAAPPLNAEAVDALRTGNLSEHCGVTGGAINRGELGSALSEMYPEQARTRGYEGYAVVRFSIAPNGSVPTASVVDELPSGMGFGEAAVRAQLMARYPPRVAVCENAATRVHFGLR